MVHSTALGATRGEQQQQQEEETRGREDKVAKGQQQQQAQLRRSPQPRASKLTWLQREERLRERPGLAMARRAAHPPLEAAPSRLMHTVPKERVQGQAGVSTPSSQVLCTQRCAKGLTMQVQGLSPLAVPLATGDGMRTEVAAAAVRSQGHLKLAHLATVVYRLMMCLRPREGLREAGAVGVGAAAAAAAGTAGTHVS